MSRRIALMLLLPLPLLGLGGALALATKTQDPSPLPAVPFMGIEAQATRVAFACDGSRWTETKDEELFAELLRAVKPLVPQQEFSVIFFADGKARGPGEGRPMAATDENKAKLRDWLDDYRLGRDSTPLPGLKLAFQGSPDAVFFVTDGHFDGYDEVARLVASLNPERATRVHAIGYFLNHAEDDSRRFVEFMEALARANGGEFKLAYADELRRQVD